jgi:beta-lactamase regulating signal transducer with metallopeptidase domain
MNAVVAACDFVAAVLFAALWQGALLAGLAWLALRAVPRCGAATRYGVWLATLLAIVVVPAATASRPHAASRIAHDAPAASRTIASAHATRNVRMGAATGAAPQPTFRDETAADVPDADDVRTAPTVAVVRVALPEGVAVAVALAWLLATAIGFARLATDYRALARLLRNATPVAFAASFPVVSSSAVAVACAVGFRHATVVLPASLAAELEPDAVAAVIEHEVAHVQRGDVWTNVLARIVAVLLPLNPAVRFVTARLALEREIACDDRVVARRDGGDAFARTLAHLASTRRVRAGLAAPRLFGSPHALVVRIEHLLDRSPRQIRASSRIIATGIAALGLAAFALQAVSPVLAFDGPANELALPPSIVAATDCALHPDHGIVYQGLSPRIMTTRSRDALHGQPAMRLPIADAATLAARVDRAELATLDLTVDASGTATGRLVSPERYPGMAHDVAALAQAGRYAPAERGCRPYTSTLRTAVRVGAVRYHTGTVVSPEYPEGWSRTHPDSCKVPALVRDDVVPVGTRVNATVRVTVDAAGNVVASAPIRARGAFGAAIESAIARRYPLSEATGFKPVRPSGAPLSWNAAHGAASYGACAQPPSYVWATRFEKYVPYGMPGTAFRPLLDAAQLPNVRFGALDRAAR